MPRFSKGALRPRWAVSSAGEHLPYKQGVSRSNRLPPTMLFPLIFQHLRRFRLQLGPTPPPPCAEAAPRLTSSLPAPTLKVIGCPEWARAAPTNQLPCCIAGNSTLRPAPSLLAASSYFSFSTVNL